MLNEYFSLLKQSNQYKFKRTISNLRIKFNKDIRYEIGEIHSSLENLIKSSFSYNNILNRYKNINKKYNLFNKILDIRLCQIKKNINLTVGIMNSDIISELINSKQIIKNKKENQNIEIYNKFDIDNKIKNKIEIINDYLMEKLLKLENIDNYEELKNKSKILENYLKYYVNSYSKNLKKKNHKIKQSLFAWKNQYIYLNKTKHYNYINNKIFFNEVIEIDNTYIKKNVKNIIKIEGEQIITGGRTLLPETILFTFKNKNRISFKNNWLQIIPSKLENESLEDFKEKIKVLIIFILEIFKMEALIIQRKDFIDKIKQLEYELFVGVNLKLIQEIQFICDFIYIIPKNIVLLPNTTNKVDNIYIKPLIGSYSIKSIKNINNLNTTYNYINKKINDYKIFTNKLENYDLEDLLYLNKNEIIDLLDIYDLTDFFDY